MKVLLVGAGGYAAGYVKALSKSNTEWVGVVDPYYESSKVKEIIDGAGIPVFRTMEDFFENRSADLTVICTPPFLHRAQSILALSHGSYVLSEKPVAPTAIDAAAMHGAEQDSGRWIAVGYQWSFSDAIQALKQDILDGVLGAPISMKTAISWPRSRAYYERGTGWGGRITKDGVTVLDSIVSNACAHYLHNMLFLLGNTMETSARAEAIDCDCFRANAIESYDTCSLRTHVGKTRLYFIASHAAERRRDPEFVYEFERATVSFAENEGSTIRAVFCDGTEKIYGNPFENNFKKLTDCMEAAARGTRPICTVLTATPHAELVERIHKEIPIRDFPKERIFVDEGADSVFVRGLFDELYEAYASEKLLSEL